MIGFITLKTKCAIPDDMVLHALWHELNHVLNFGRKVYQQQTLPSFELCYSECLGPPLRITYSTPQEFQLTRDVLLDVLLVSAGQDSTTLFVRDAHFASGLYSVVVGSPNAGSSPTSFLTRLSDGQNMFAADASGIVSINAGADYIVHQSQELQPGAVVQFAPGRNISLCSYFAGYAPNTCIFGSPEFVGNVSIRRADSMNTTCREQCLAKSLVNLPPSLSLCPAGKEWSHPFGAHSCRHCGNNTFRDLADQFSQTCTRCTDGFITVMPNRQGARHPKACKNWCTYGRRLANFSILGSSNRTASGMAYDQVTGAGLHWYSFLSSPQPHTMVLPRMTHADIFMIAGGGGGGTDFGGGGGAGAYFLASTMAFLPGTYVIDVGTGGESRQPGKDTRIWHEGDLFLRVKGGSPGGSFMTSPFLEGGCGGGSTAFLVEGWSTASNAGSNGTCFSGGKGLGINNSTGGGGGGGAGGVGGHARTENRLVGIDEIQVSIAGSGGTALEVDLRGNTETFGGGGGGYGFEGFGGRVTTKVGGDGGQVLVQGGQVVHVAGKDAFQDTGSGGGGSGIWYNRGGSGSSGIVILR